MRLNGERLVVLAGANGSPERFVVDGMRYCVTDTPTPLEFDFEFITHLASIPVGWRLQGTSDDGDSLVFDLAYSAELAEWRVLNTYR